MLQHGFAGDNGKLLDPIDLLPFPDELRKIDKEPSKVSEATDRIMRSLLKSEKLPPHVVAQVESVL